MTKYLVVILLLNCSLCAAATEFHVSTDGSDANDGSRDKPFLTISAAAAIAQPGDTITVHAGIYRERINPPRGGDSDAKRIVYQAAPGEKVEITGSEPATGWKKVQDDIWEWTQPNSAFGSFNPYRDLIHGDWYHTNNPPYHTGAVYLNGDWLTEATKLDDLTARKVPGNLFNVASVAIVQKSGAAALLTLSRPVAVEGTRFAPCSEGGECLGWIEDGHWVRYDNVDFGESANGVTIRAASPGRGGEVELHLDSPDGPLLGTCAIAGTGDWQAWSSFQAAITPTSGRKTLCLVFRPPPRSALWFGQVDDKNTTIRAQFLGVDPNRQQVEINVRRTVFYPEKTGINYLTVRGFILRDAATPWAPPTAEQIGLIGTHWSKGWIIENNEVSYSMCSGVALGKYGDEWDNKSQSADAYNRTIQRALQNGWSKENIGHHIVRNNTISHCEQTGIVGSLGAVFSVVSGNTIHDIHVKNLFAGEEMAAIKFHAAIDVQIVHNHLYHNNFGIWLDWMAQGARVSANLCHDNQKDCFFEVNHGPFLVDDNILLSERSIDSWSNGGAFVHNLIAGSFSVSPFDKRQTPFMKPHSTGVAGLHDNPAGDDRLYNNLFVGHGGLATYDKAPKPVWMDGNVFFKGAAPSVHEKDPVRLPDVDPTVKLSAEPGGFFLSLTLPIGWAAEHTRKLVTTDLLGTVVIPDARYETPDGAPTRVDTDYFGRPRDGSNPAPGPFAHLGSGDLKVRVWDQPNRGSLPTGGQR